jgi:hypothetical protein
MYKKAVLAGGCFWGEKWGGTHFARPCEVFMNEMKQKATRCTGPVRKHRYFNNLSSYV